MNFTERLLELRNNHNITQKQVAEGINSAMISYQRYEYGQREPTLQKLIALADYLTYH